MKILFYCLIIFFFSSFLLAQNQLKLEDLRKKYESFEYQDVIRLSEIFLYNNQEIPMGDSLEVLTMKAVSHYSLNEIDGAEKTFIEILKLDYTYNLDPAKISPKVIFFFNEIKLRYVPQEESVVQQEKPEIETSHLSVAEMTSLQNSLYTTTFTKSVLLPGWGHLNLNENTKGWLLTSVSAVTLGSMIYFIFDTNSKESAYLNESNPELIPGKYEKYNSSYKIRNSLIIGYAILWIYSQLDLLYFSNELFSEKIKATISPQLDPNNDLGYKINFKISF